MERPDVPGHLDVAAYQVRGDFISFVEDYGADIG
jgi:hypothetical protein